MKVLDKPFLDLTTTMGKGILVFLSSLAQDERERILRRGQEGREAAKARGVQFFGPKRKLTKHQRQRACERLTEGETATAIAADMGVHKSTISRMKC